ncbi:ThuA domain-containing protein [Arsenicibacter rosenii]|nr:ThuA domain-containing protein [Arsenicibacter rosenii]
MHKLRISVLSLLTVGGLALASSSALAQRVLVFSKTKGFRHSSIPAGKRAIMKLGQDNGFAVDTTEDASAFTDANLKKYDAVIFLSTTGDVLDNDQQKVFENYIHAGGGYAGIHAAADTEYDWPWYNQLVGAYFLSHPKQQNAEIVVTDKSHPATQMLPDRWKRYDEWYNYRNIVKGIRVVAKLDEKTYEGGKNGDDHPFVWYRDFEGGRSFYTGGGHTDESYSDPMFLQHLLGGINYARQKKADDLIPEENRFTRHVLAERLDEPTELVVLNDGRVLLAERKGALKLFNPKTKAVKVVANLPVYTKFEYGLMGLNIDPKFKDNKWLYMYYSPVANAEGDTAQRLVRVKYDDSKDEIVPNTEQVLLKVPVKRNDCCHTGGSIAWDRQGNLYLSTGDDTNPFNSNGYGPIDERPGRAGWDGQAGPGNTNDLRGKILRITPHPTDAKYSIPAGNLFAPGNDKARAEIYVMGNRNPYRISVDQRTGFLYWGEVGPDAGENSESRGPRGHDEVNQARKAGNFGWPFFVGDNKAYRDYNFATETSGPAFDPMKPINDSPNNTGLRELPPAQKAFIYYPYADSPEFGPIVGKGGRNAMGGPVYYYDDYPENAVKFPRHYDGKFFSYEWIRDYIHPVTMTKEGDFVTMEHFMPNTKFSHPIDMQFANDGTLYVLEYGQTWFAQNDDARLSRITYNAGNRQPVAIASANKTVGSAPLTVQFSSKGSSDPDGDAIKYEWSFGKGLAKNTQANPTFTFAKAGTYETVLKVTDAKGNVSTKNLQIKVGNDQPKVEVAVKGNKTFFFDNKPVQYEVKVADKEDGSLANGKIAPEDVTVTVDYLEGFDKTILAQGHQANLGFATGKRLIELSDCKACHSIDRKSVGPAYIDVAKKYKGVRNALSTLAEKVIKGGGGVWGEQAMSAHPQLSIDDTKDMVRYILSLADDKSANKKPVKGEYVPAPKSKDGSYIFSASYTDRGNGAMGPLTATSSVALRNPKVKASTYDEGKGVSRTKGTSGADVVISNSTQSYIAFNNIDLNGIRKLSLTPVKDAKAAGGKIEVRLGSPTGALIGEAEIKGDATSPVEVPLRQPGGAAQTVYFVFVNPSAGTKALLTLDTIQFAGDSM